MATKKVSEGVGKKIVEALKKQSEIEINPVPAKAELDDSEIFDELNESFESEYQQAQDLFSDASENSEGENYSEGFEKSNISNEQFADETPLANQQFVNYQQIPARNQDSFIKELDSFEIPSNIAVLKKLITQLPSGVSRHTGAQIIKQTMEALGISMKSVLQEAQQVQDGLNASANECLNNVQEYKKQILALEKQSQNYHRQYTALNELISLFIQTGV
jgi:hypothetical protein